MTDGVKEALHARDRRGALSCRDRTLDALRTLRGYGEGTACPRSRAFKENRMRSVPQSLGAAMLVLSGCVAGGPHAAAGTSANGDGYSDLSSGYYMFLAPSAVPSVAVAMAAHPNGRCKRPRSGACEQKKARTFSEP